MMVRVRVQYSSVAHVAHKSTDNENAILCLCGMTHGIYYYTWALRFLHLLPRIGHLAFGDTFFIYVFPMTWDLGMGKPKMQK